MSPEQEDRGALEAEIERLQSLVAQIKLFREKVGSLRRQGMIEVPPVVSFTLETKQSELMMSVNAVRKRLEELQLGE